MLSKGVTSSSDLKFSLYSDQDVEHNQFMNMLANVSGEPFKLSDTFIRDYVNKSPNFGFNGLGEFVFYRTYSRLKDDNTKEKAYEVFKRVVEGTYEIQRRHCRLIHVPWDYGKAQDSAQEMFTRMWQFKFLPPGRGLWCMGTEFMFNRGGTCLNNCAFISTKGVGTNPSDPFCFLMDLSMLGVGVGFDTRGSGAFNFTKPDNSKKFIFDIPDTREGWVDTILLLLMSYTMYPEIGNVEFKYDKIRKKGEPIRGFGGFASGPDVLYELNNDLRSCLDNAIGKNLSSVHIVDINNMIGKAVVAGNVRRSSEIGIGNLDDKEYISMKNPTRDLTSDEVGQYYNVVGELYKKLNPNDTLVVSHADFADTSIPADKLNRVVEVTNALNNYRWASNNSIFAEVGMDYSEVVKSTIANGEPGFIWLDNLRNYGRFIDGKKPGIDSRVDGCNPCFSGNMRLLTQQGYVSLESLWLSTGMNVFSGHQDDMLEYYGTQKIVNNNGIVDATKVYKTGSREDIWRVQLEDNAFIDATDNHIFITAIKHDDENVEYKRVKLNELKAGDLIPLNNTTHFGVHHDPVYAELAGWLIGGGSLKTEIDHCRIYSAFDKFADDHFDESVQKSKHVVTDVSDAVHGMLKSDGLSDTSEHAVPCSIWNGTRDTVAKFLRGFILANSTVAINNDTMSIKVKKSNEQFLYDCRLLLNQFGIASSVWKRKTGTLKLLISGTNNISKFINNIYSLNDFMPEQAGDWLSDNVVDDDSPQFVKVRSITYIGRQDTYCLTEPESNQIVIEGCQIGQCTEQSLESHEMCCLVEQFPVYHDDANDFLRTCKYAYLYGKTVTLVPTHVARTNQVMLRNRRIGLSQSGIVQAFKKFGRRAVLRDFCDAGYNEITAWDNIYSDWLCVPRSIKKTSVKPSGSVSLLVGCTPGIHYPEAKAYWRHVRLPKNSQLVPILIEAGYHVEPEVRDPANTVVARFAVDASDLPSIEDVTIWDQILDVVDYQYYWCDNQPSCTVKFKPDEANQVQRVLEVFDDRLKAVSFLPWVGHNYVQPPYQPVTPEEVAEYNSKLKPLDFSSYIDDNSSAEGTKFCDSDKCELP